MMSTSPRSRRTPAIVFSRACARTAPPPSRSPARRGPQASPRCRGASCARPPATSSPPTIVGRPIRVDASRKLLPWSPSPAPYAEVARLAWTALETKFPVQDNGLPTYLAYSRFDPDDLSRRRLAAQPGRPLRDAHRLGASSGTRSAATSAAVDLARTALDHQLAHGTTPADWDWAGVPYASASPGEVDYRGGDDEWCDFCGRGDGVGVIEPDKVGELGFAYLQVFELTGDARYRDAAVACADALAKHVRDGDEAHSPWPFRVYAQTNVAREEYSSNVVGAIMLFDELARLDLGDVDAYATRRAHGVRLADARADAQRRLERLLRGHRDPDRSGRQPEPVRARCARRAGSCSTADADPRWRDHVAHLLAWVVQTFGGDTRERARHAVGRDRDERAERRHGQDGEPHGALRRDDGALVRGDRRSDGARAGGAVARLGDVHVRRARASSPSGRTATRAGGSATGTATTSGTSSSRWARCPSGRPRGENHLLRSTSVVTHVDVRAGPRRVDDVRRRRDRDAAPPVAPATR